MSVVVAFKGHSMGSSWEQLFDPALARYGVGPWAECPFVMVGVTWLIRSLFRSSNGTGMAAGQRIPPVTHVHRGC